MLLTAVVVCVVVLGQINWSFAHKVVAGLLPWGEISLLAVAMLLMHLCHCMNIFGLAHRKDYFFRFAVASNLTTSIAVLGCGWKWGATGVVVAVLAVTALVQVPAYLYRWTDRDQWAADL